MVRRYISTVLRSDGQEIYINCFEGAMVRRYISTVLRE